MRSWIKVVLAGTLGLAALVLNPWFGVTSGFDFDEAEMRAAIEGTWRLTVPPTRGAPRDITFRIAQGTAARPSLGLSRALVSPAAACGTRSLVRNAGACLDSTDMPLEITILAGAAPAGSTAGAPATGSIGGARFLVIGTHFTTGSLRAKIADVALECRVSPIGTASELVLTFTPDDREHDGATLTRIAR